MSTSFKKVVSAISVGAVLATTVGSSIVAAASGFLPFAEALADAKVITKQSTEAGYRLADNALRQEVVAMATALAKLTPADTCAGKYEDVSATKPNSWVCKVVEAALSKGLIAANATFRPEDKITRAEALAMILKGQGIEIPAVTASSFNDVKEGWQVNVAEVALTKKIISANTSFRPNDLVTRGELFVMAANAAGLEIASDDLDLDDLFDDDEDTTSTGTTSTGTTGDTGTVVKAGDLAVRLSPTTPAAKSVAGTGTNISVMNFDISAGTSDVTLNAITLSRVGLGDNASVSKIYIRNSKSIVVTNQRSLSSDGTARLAFNNGYTVKAGSTETLTVYVDLSGAVNKEYQFSIASASAIEATSATVSGTYPVVSNLIRGVNYTAQTVTITGNESALNDTPTNTLTVGDTSVEIGRFTLGSSSENKKDVFVKSVRLKNRELVSSYFDNVKVRAGSSEIAGTITRDGKYLIVSLGDAGYKIPYGNTVTFYINADVIGGEANDKLQFFLDENSDIEAYEGESMSSVAISTSNKYLKAYKILEGDNVISKASETPTDTYVGNDTKDNTVLVSNVNFKSEVNVDKMRVYASASTTITNVVDKAKLYVNGVYVDEGTWNTSGYYVFNVYKNLKGLNKFAVKLDILKTAATDSYVELVTVKKESFTDEVAEYVSTNNAVPTSEISGEAVSSKFTVKKPTITGITRNDGFANGDDVVRGSTTTKLGSFVIQSNNVKKIVINSLDVTRVAGERANISTVTVKVGSTEKSKSLSSDTVTFDSLNIEVPVGANPVVELYANIGASHGTGTNNVQFKIEDLNADFVNDNGSTTSITSDIASVDVSTVTFDVLGGANVKTLKLSDSTPASSVMAVSSTTETEVARFDVKVEQDDAMIQELVLTGSAGANDLGAQFALFLGTEKVADYKPLSISGTTYYVHYQLESSKYINLPKNTDISLIVKAKVNSNIDTASKTNKDISVTLVKNVAGTTAKTKIVSKANSSDVTPSTISLTSNSQLVRRTTLNISNDVVSSDSYSVQLSTSNGSQAAFRVIPLDVKVNNVGGDSSTNDVLVKLTGFEVAGADKKADVKVLTGSFKTLSGASLVNVSSAPTLTFSTASTTEQRFYVVVSATGGLDIAGAGTSVKFKYEISGAAGSDTVEVRIPELADEATANQYDSFYSMDNGALSSASTFSATNVPTAYGLVWSDKAESDLSTNVKNWFTDRKVTGLDTAWKKAR